MTLIDRTSLLTTDILPRVRPSHALFTLAFSNSKKRGAGKSERHYEAEGTLYSSGHVHVDTLEVRVCDFLNINQMTDYFEQFGSCRISWMEH